MDEKTKIELFEQVLRFTKLSMETTYDYLDYYSMAEGAFRMLSVLGIDKEYIQWSIGK